MTSRTLLSFVCLVSLAAGCGEGAGEVDLFPVGDPLGERVTATIGPEGGTLSYDEGRFALVVPPGALTAPIELGVQEIERTAPRGTAPAFRLTPHGTTFGEPVELRFALSEDERARPSALLPATQDERGAWLVLGDVEWDVDAGTLTTRTTHFSDWTYVESFTLEAPKETVKVGESVPLVVKSCLHEDVDDGEVVLAALTRTCRPFTLLALVKDEAVNGVVGGDLAVGTVDRVGETLTYTAPLAVPAANPVAVSARVDVAFVDSEVIVVRSLTVVDPETYRGVATFAHEAGDRVSAEVTFTATEDFDGVIGYEPSGRVTASLPGCAISPSTADIMPDDGYLEIDFTYSPPRYYGGGTTTWEATVSCEGAEPVVFLVGGTWWYTEPVPASDDGRVLEGDAGWWSWSLSQ